MKIPGSRYRLVLVNRILTEAITTEASCVAIERAIHTAPVVPVVACHETDRYLNQASLAFMTTKLVTLYRSALSELKGSDT